MGGTGTGAGASSQSGMGGRGSGRGGEGKGWRKGSKGSFHTVSRGGRHLVDNVMLCNVVTTVKTKVYSSH